MPVRAKTDKRYGGTISTTEVELQVMDNSNTSSFTIKEAFDNRKEKVQHAITTSGYKSSKEWEYIQGLQLANIELNEVTFRALSKQKMTSVKQTLKLNLRFNF